MASALISGIINGGLDPKAIIASSPEDSHLAALDSNYGIKTTKDNKKIASNCKTIVLAVKPHIVNSILIELAELINNEEHLIISIAAGIKIQDIQAQLKELASLQCLALVYAGNEEEMIEQNQFRQDLYHRINVFPVTIPSLMEKLP